MEMIWTMGIREVDREFRGGTLGILDLWVGLFVNKSTNQYFYFPSQGGSLGFSWCCSELCSCIRGCPT